MRNSILFLILLLFAAIAPALGQGFLYIESSGDTLTVVPSNYILSYTTEADGAHVLLSTGKTLVVPEAKSAVTECPVVLPSFNLYRFSNKYNDQLFQTVTANAEQLSQDTIRLSVPQIGKSLTATFRLTSEDASAWVGTVPQASEVTRQRMGSPVTYTIGFPCWRQLELQEDETGFVTYHYVPFGRRVTVIVDFPTDHPTGEFNVPRIDITTTTGAVPLSKENYITASITIDGAGVYPDMPATDIQIKGRGNSSWSSSAQSKNPYHFKFAEKQKPLGMKAGKHWILLSNKQNGSMMCNALAQKASALAGCAAVCHIVPVELYMNGRYRGSYNLTEKVGFYNNNVNLDDESCAAMLELDTYDDEPYYMYNSYYIPTKIHEPDFDDEDPSLLIDTWDILMDWMDALQSVRYGDSEEYIGHFDLDCMASFLFSSEICYNSELQHPKSVFLYSENVLDDGFVLTGKDDTPWVFGPIWDCDWSFGYQFGNTYYFVNAAESAYFEGWLRSMVEGFWYDLRYKSQQLDKAYFTLWHNFMTDGRLEELIDYVQDYYDFAAPSLKHNAKNVTTERDAADYAATARRAAQWFQKRANYVYSRLTTYDIDVEPEPFWPTPVIVDTEDGIFTTLSGQSRKPQDVWYDLSGRRVPENQHRQRGIYITPQGRKVLVK